MVRTRSVRLADPGAPLQVADVDLAEPGDGEVLVTLDHATVNPLDTYAAAGQVGDVDRLPRTLGVEGTGLVNGRRVVVHGGGLGLTRDGTWAGALVAPRGSVVEVPAGIDPVQAAALPVAGVTAHRVVRDLGRVGPADRVLVLAAAGGVGSVVVQLAKLAGATVCGQVGSEAKRAAVLGLGADRAAACDAAGLAAAVGDFRPTVVLDPLGGAFLAAAIDLAEPSGRIVTYGASAGPEAVIPVRTFYRNGLSLLGYGGIRESPARVAEAVEAVAQDVLAGRVHIPVGEVLRLDRIGDALALLRSRTVVGKIVLDVRS